jgi:hypothetical protein
MAVVAEAYDAQTTITKAMLLLLKNFVLLRGFEFMRYRFLGDRFPDCQPHSNTAPPAIDSDFSHVDCDKGHLRT